MRFFKLAKNEDAKFEKGAYSEFTFTGSGKGIGLGTGLIRAGGEGGLGGFSPFFRSRNRPRIVDGFGLTFFRGGSEAVSSLSIFLFCSKT